MPPQKEKEICITIRDEDHFLQFYKPENQKLLIIDVHPQWSGPCEMMNQFWKNLQLNSDEFEKRCDILLLDKEKLVNQDKVDKLERFEPVTCEPRFFLVVEGKIKEEIIGANTPLLEEKIKQNYPIDL